MYVREDAYPPSYKGDLNVLIICPFVVYIDEGNVFEASPDNRRQIGVFSAALLIFNRVIGTGIFATPSTILELSGSVGLSLFMWVIGTAIALAGTAVYLEWGTAIPRYVHKDPPVYNLRKHLEYAKLL